jgi:hypothetical protein
MGSESVGKCVPQPLLGTLAPCPGVRNTCGSYVHVFAARKKIQKNFC